jgi:hypothetical protein
VIYTRATLVLAHLCQTRQAFTASELAAALPGYWYREDAYQALTSLVREGLVHRGNQRPAQFGVTVEGYAQWLELGAFFVDDNSTTS